MQADWDKQRWCGRLWPMQFFCVFTFNTALTAQPRQVICLIRVSHWIILTLNVSTSCTSWDKRFWITVTWSRGLEIKLVLVKYLDLTTGTEETCLSVFQNSSSSFVHCHLVKKQHCVLSLCDSVCGFLLQALTLWYTTWVNGYISLQRMNFLIQLFRYSQINLFWIITNTYFNFSYLSEYNYGLWRGRRINPLIQRVNSPFDSKGSFSCLVRVHNCIHSFPFIGLVFRWFKNLCHEVITLQASFPHPPHL